MKKLHCKKKVWVKPAVYALSIEKDTFGGSGYGAEGAAKEGPPQKS